MPCGSCKGQPVDSLPSARLLWWVSQDKLRKRWPATVHAMLAELRARFTQGERIEGELLPDYCDLA